MSAVFGLGVGLLSILCLGSIGCDARGRPARGPEAPLPGQVIDFATLYKQNCAGCHGENGKNGAAISLADPVYLAIAGEAALRQVTANGIAGTLMPAFEKSAGGTLTDRQIDSLVQGMLQQWGRPDVVVARASLYGKRKARSNAGAENLCRVLRSLSRGRRHGNKRCPRLDCRSFLSRAGERSKSAQYDHCRTARPGHAGLALGHLRPGVACDD